MQYNYTEIPKITIDKTFKNNNKSRMCMFIALSSIAEERRVINVT